MISEDSPSNGSVPRDVFVQLGGILLGAQPLTATLQQVAEIAKQVVPDAVDVSVTVMDGHKPRTVAFTGQLAVDLDERQYQAGFGPCMDAATTGDTIVVATRDDNPYPLFSAAASKAGINHVLSVGMPVPGRVVVGGLNFYTAIEDPVDDDTRALVATFAGFAAVAVANAATHSSTAELVQQLQASVKSRAVIEQAKGMLMAQNHCSSDEAFQLLVNWSQHSNTKLRDVAATVVQQTQDKNPAR